MDANTVAEQTIFQTGWFLEGLLSQVLVVLVMRSRHGLRAAGTPAADSSATTSAVESPVDQSSNASRKMSS